MSRFLLLALLVASTSMASQRTLFVTEDSALQSEIATELDFTNHPELWSGGRRDAEYLVRTTTGYDTLDVRFVKRADSSHTAFYFNPKLEEDVNGVCELRRDYLCPPRSITTIIEGWIWTGNGEGTIASHDDISLRQGIPASGGSLTGRVYSQNFPDFYCGEEPDFDDLLVYAFLPNDTSYVVFDENTSGDDFTYYTGASGEVFVSLPSASASVLLENLWFSKKDPGDSSLRNDIISAYAYSPYSTPVTYLDLHVRNIQLCTAIRSALKAQGGTIKICSVDNVDFIENQSFGAIVYKSYDTELISFDYCTFTSSKFIGKSYYLCPSGQNADILLYIGGSPIDDELDIDISNCQFNSSGRLTSSDRNNSFGVKYIYSDMDYDGSSGPIPTVGVDFDLNCTISDCIFTGTYNAGVYFRHVSNYTNNTWNISNVDIIGCDFIHCFYGIYFDHNFMDVNINTSLSNGGCSFYNCCNGILASTSLKPWFTYQDAVEYTPSSARQEESRTSMDFNISEDILINGARFYSLGIDSSETMYQQFSYYYNYPDTSQTAINFMSGFKQYIASMGTGILAYGKYKNLTISNCIVNGASDSGIKVINYLTDDDIEGTTLSTTNTVISGNYIYNTLKTAIYAVCGDMTVSGNQIDFYHNSPLRFFANCNSRSDLYRSLYPIGSEAALGMAISIHSMNDICSNADNIIIHDNVMDHCPVECILLEGTDFLDVSNVTIVDNLGNIDITELTYVDDENVTQHTRAYWPTIWISDASFVDVHDNEFDGLNDYQSTTLDSICATGMVIDNCHDVDFYNNTLSHVVSLGVVGTENYSGGSAKPAYNINIHNNLFTDVVRTSDNNLRPIFNIGANLCIPNVWGTECEYRSPDCGPNDPTMYLGFYNNSIHSNLICLSEDHTHETNSAYYQGGPVKLHYPLFFDEDYFGFTAQDTTSIENTVNTTLSSGCGLPDGDINIIHTNNNVLSGNFVSYYGSHVQQALDNTLGANRYWTYSCEISASDTTVSNCKPHGDYTTMAANCYYYDSNSCAVRQPMDDLTGGYSTFNANNFMDAVINEEANSRTITIDLSSHTQMTETVSTILARMDFNYLDISHITLECDSTTNPSIVFDSQLVIPDSIHVTIAPPSSSTDTLSWILDAITVGEYAKLEFVNTHVTLTADAEITVGTGSTLALTSSTIAGPSSAEEADATFASGSELILTDSNFEFIDDTDMPSTSVSISGECTISDCSFSIEEGTSFSVTGNDQVTLNDVTLNQLTTVSAPANPANPVNPILSFTPEDSLACLEINDSVIYGRRRCCIYADNGFLSVDGVEFIFGYRAIFQDGNSTSEVQNSLVDHCKSGLHTYGSGTSAIYRNVESTTNSYHAIYAFHTSSIYAEDCYFHGGTVQIYLWYVPSAEFRNVRAETHNSPLRAIGSSVIMDDIAQNTFVQWENPTTQMPALCGFETSLSMGCGHNRVLSFDDCVLEFPDSQLLDSLSALDGAYNYWGSDDDQVVAASLCIDSPVYLPICSDSTTISSACTSRAVAGSESPQLQDSSSDEFTRLSRVIERDGSAARIMSALDGLILMVRQSRLDAKKALRLFDQVKESNRFASVRHRASVHAVVCRNWSLGHIATAEDFLSLAAASIERRTSYERWAASEMILALRAQETTESRICNSVFADMCIDELLEFIDSPNLSESSALSAVLPSSFKIASCTPNPFNPQTVITLDVPEASVVKLVVYNLRGQLVSTLHNTELQAGSQSFIFDGSRFGSGIYLVQASSSNGWMDQKKITLIK